MVRLLDGDGRWDAIDRVRHRLVHAVEELPRVGAERLDVAALALGVDRIEREARFAGATRPVTTINLPSGRSRSIPLRLFWRAPRIADGLL